MTVVKQTLVTVGNMQPLQIVSLKNILTRENVYETILSEKN